MSAQRRILLVAYYYPPQNIIGARRPYALAKWLRRRGHDVTALTSVQTGRGADGAASRVVRSRDLLATRLNWRGHSMQVVTGQSDAVWNPEPGIWGSVFVPDVQLMSWAPFAAAAARRLHRRLRFDAVVTTSPVESAHVAGIALQRRGVPWIADLRDGWRFEAPRKEWPTRLQRRFDGQLEQIVVRTADAVVTVSEPLSADLRRRHEVPVATITNGFDPDEPVAAVPYGAVDPAKLTLVHTGGLGAERTLSPLLEALAGLANEDPSIRGRIELVLAGQQTAAEGAMYSREEFAPFVKHLGFLARRESIALQRTADVLVLVTSGSRAGEATGKLYEYLASGRPILVLGAGSAAGDIVRSAGAGVAIPTHDASAAKTAVRRIVAGGLGAPPASAGSRFAYPALAERYEQVIEAAIARRAG